MPLMTADRVHSGLTITGQQRLTDKGDPYVQPLKKQIPVERVDTCRGQRRTHIHLNGGCWDGRTVLEVVPTIKKEN